MMVLFLHLSEAAGVQWSFELGPHQRPDDGLKPTVETSRSILDVNLFALCVCVCEHMCGCIFSGPSEWFLVTPNLTQQDKMLPLALLFSAPFPFVSFFSFTFFMFPDRRGASCLLQRDFKLNSAVSWKADMNHLHCHGFIWSDLLLLFAVMH